MSKSLGNVRTVRELLERYPGEVLRFALLSAQYRSPLNFSEELLEQAQSTIDGFYLSLRNVADVPAEPALDVESTVFKALLDDLNTPAAIAELHQLAKQLNKASSDELSAAKTALLSAGHLLGILHEDPESWFAAKLDESLDATAIDALVVERFEAKLARDFARADAIREELNAAGIVIEDGPDGSAWRRG